MSETIKILTVRGQWAKTEYLKRGGNLYRRGKNGGWGGGYDPKDFRANCEPIDEGELEAVILQYGLEDEFDEGEVGMSVDVGR